MAGTTGGQPQYWLIDDEEIPVIGGDEEAAAPSLSPAAAPARASAVPEKQDLLVPTPAEQREIAKIVAAEPEMATFAATIATPVTLDLAVDEAIAASGASLADDDAKRRFRMLVSMYFRDLRDRLETLSKFTMPVVSGGMGMTDAEAEKAMTVFETKCRAYRDTELARMKQGKTEYVAEQAGKQLAGTVEREKTDQDMLDQAHQRLLAKTGLVEAAAPGIAIPAPIAPPKMIPVVSMSAPKPVQVVVPPTPAPAAPAEPSTFKMVEPPPNLPVAPIETKLDMPEVGTGLSVEASSGPLQPIVPKASTPPFPRPAVVPPPTPSPAPRPVTPPPAPMPVAPPPVPSKPMMTDVQVAPKLTGPVEELRQLRIVDFRRLSKEPREATLKIKDKIDLLEDQGFENKTQGIKAWNDSEVNRMYLDILRRSLEGKPVMDVIAEMDAKGEPTLAKVEFDALMELNRKLRFG